MADSTTPDILEDTEARASGTAVEDAPPAAAPAQSLVEADLLVEDVSIDGMCGVY